jgi:hypothetical protein
MENAISVSSTTLARYNQVPWKGSASKLSAGRLKTSKNGRFLIYEDGSPFFYLGDTAWELFHRLKREEIEVYLENRRSKGYTVIQVVLLSELDGLNTPNTNGDRPLIDNNPETPNEAYFKYVDEIINLAASKGMFIGLLPTWGDKMEKMPWGTGPVIFNETNARHYGNWLGKRYKDFPNIIWINGGDRFGGDEGSGAGGPKVNLLPIWNSLANGIKETDPNHLMTFHPIGFGKCSSSVWFHNEEWLDFNMLQTGHREISFSCYVNLIDDYSLIPVKPVIDGEPRYEDHPIAWEPESLGWFNEMHVRQAAYWSVFSGAFGHVYGCHAIWQFLTKENVPVGFARHTWQEDLDLPGACQMLNLRRLMESRPMLDRVPYPEIVLNPGDEFNRIIATKGEGYIMIYSALGGEIELLGDLLRCEIYMSWWFDPRSGIASKNGMIIKNKRLFFKPPSRGPGFDWILVLDEMDYKFDQPGEPSGNK